MLKIIITLFISVISFNHHVFSQETEDARQELILPSFNSPSISKTENQILKTTLVRVSAEQKEYQIVFKDSNVNINQPYLYLDSKIIKTTSSKLKIELSIISLKTKKLVKKIISDPFNKKLIIKKFEVALRVLFNLEKITELNPQEKETVIQRRKRVSKNKEAEAKRRQEKDKNTVDFRERILNIKVDIPEKIKKEKEKIEEEKEKVANKNNSNSKLLLEKKEEDQGLEIPLTTKEKGWTRNYTFFAEYITEELKVMDSRNGFEEVVINNSLSFYSVGATIDFVPPISKTFTLFTQFAIVIPLTEFQEELDRYTDMHFGANYNFKAIDAKFSLSYYMTSKVFVSLPEQGSGLKPSKIDSSFLDFTLNKSITSLFSGEFQYLFHLQSKNSSTHEIQTAQYEYSSMSLGLFYNSSAYIRKSNLYIKIKSESFDNKSQLKGSSTSISIGLDKKF